MSNISPAPWAVQPLQATHGADMAIVAADGAIVALIEHDPAIQTENDPDGVTVVWSDTDRANANALAAAPDLLSATKAMLALAEREYLYLAHKGTAEGKVIAEARAAIAKAEQRTSHL